MEAVRIAPRTDWSAILAGAVLATAIGLVLLGFGAAIGLSITSPYDGEGASPAAYVIAVGMWLLWVQLVSFSIGGYVAARLRTVTPDATEQENDVRDGLHGVLAWAAGVIAAAVISYAALGGATAAIQSEDGRGDVIESVAQAAAAEIGEAAAEEPAVNPEAADESAAEREAEIARKLGILAAFATAASLLVGAAVAFFAAGFGGKHRDENTRIAFFVQRRGLVQVQPVATPAQPPPSV